MTDTFRIEQFAHNPVRRVLLASTKELGIDTPPPIIKVVGVEVEWSFVTGGTEEIFTRNHDDTTMGWEYRSLQTDLLVVIIAKE